MDRRPVYFGHMGVKPIGLDSRSEGGSVRLGAPAWQNLASELLRRARSPRRTGRALAVFLSHAQGFLPIDLASQAGESPATAEMHYWKYRDVGGDRTYWDIEAHTIVRELVPDEAV